MLHTAVLRSPHAAASVARIDLRPALALPGVQAAIGPGEAARRASFVDDEPRVRERGDYEQGLAAADVVVSGEFRTAVVLHNSMAVSYTHLRAHETPEHLVCRL